MEPDGVLVEIHAESRSRSLPDLSLLNGWRIGDVSRLEHKIIRSFDVSPFHLHHLWIDLRTAASA
jgi:hypothetical protein